MPASCQVHGAGTGLGRALGSGHVFDEPQYFVPRLRRRRGRLKDGRRIGRRSGGLSRRRCGWGPPRGAVVERGGPAIDKVGELTQRECATAVIDMSTDSRARATADIGISQTRRGVLSACASQALAPITLGQQRPQACRIGLEPAGSRTPPRPARAPARTSPSRTAPRYPLPSPRSAAGVGWAGWLL